MQLLQSQVIDINRKRKIIRPFDDGDEYVTLLFIAFSFLSVALIIKLKWSKILNKSSKESIKAVRDL